MTGPEHYAEAERLIAEITNPAVLAPTLSLAQVHATLALALATALAPATESAPIAVWNEWLAVAGTQVTP